MWYKHFFFFLVQLYLVLSTFFLMFFCHIPKLPNLCKGCIFPCIPFAGLSRPLLSGARDPSSKCQTAPVLLLHPPQSLASSSPLPSRSSLFSSRHIHSSFPLHFTSGPHLAALPQVHSWGRKKHDWQQEQQE